MKRVLFSATLIFSFILVTGLSEGQSVNKETRDVKGFTKVSFGIAGNLEIKIGKEFSVVLEGDKNDLHEVITELSGEKLLIKQDNWRFNFKQKVNVYVTLPELKGLSVSGSGDAEILDGVKTGELDLNVSGSGKIITSELIVEKLNCDISGSGNITLGSGSASNADFSISGSGSFTGDAMVVKVMDISVSGSGNATCNVTGSLEASISGSGNITYKGDPAIDARVSGSGHVRSSR